jgi:glycosyltransferase involved in cell wall biosynthesis
MDQKQGANSISVFFPAFNDEGSIARLVNEALEVLPRLTDDYEVIVVDDGSMDSTPQILDELAAASSQIRVIHHSRNLGYGAGLRSGFSHAGKDLIFYTDGDGQYDVRELVNLFPLMTDEVDVVNGWKRKRSDSLRRVILGEVYKRLARFMFKLPIRDVDCDFRLIRRSALRRIELISSSGIICTEMIYKLCRAGCLFVGTPVNHYPRLHGQSQFFTMSRVARTLFDFLFLWLKLCVWQRIAQSQTGTFVKKALVRSLYLSIAVICFFSWWGVEEPVLILMR